MKSLVNRYVLVTCAALLICAPTMAQVTEMVTGFETDREGNLFPAQPGSYGDLSVVMFQDPAEAEVTTSYIVADGSPDADTSGILPATEESFVANFVGDSFYGAGGSDQSLDIRFQWASSNGTRWCLVETFQSPIMGDPAIHLDGKVSMKVNFPVYAAEFPALNYTNKIGVALLIRETGNDIPLGFRDGGDGDLEFFGVESVQFADSNGPIPVPTLFINGPTGGSDQGWLDLEFDLANDTVTFDGTTQATNVIGWEYNGGNGVLDATTNGDLVNRGVIAGLVLTVDATDVTSDYVEFMLDDIELYSPVNDPTYPPTIDTPVTDNMNTIRVKDILSTASNVSLEIDRAPAGDPFVAEETYNTAPGGALYVDMGVPAMGVGDQLRARQTNPSGVSEYSTVITVNPAAAFSFTMALDEDGLGSAVADFEFVGASSKIGGAPLGKPVYKETGVWQNIEFSLIPGVEPVLDFAGGNGVLEPDGGFYRIDSIWFTIDASDPRTEPYDVFVDHIYYIDESDNEVLISDAETTNPFGSMRGQSTTCLPDSEDCANEPDISTILSGLTSYDGLLSNRLRWKFPNTDTDNTASVYRPSGNFPDTAKKVGFWLLVEDVRTNGIPIPSIVAPIIGDVDGVTVDVTTDGIASVELFLNGVSIGTELVASNGIDSVVFDTSTIGLGIGDHLTAIQTTTTNGISDPSRPRVVIEGLAPSIVGPVKSSDNSIVVNDILTVAFSTASEVNIYVNTNALPIGTADPAGATSVEVSLTAALEVGDIVYAAQTVNGIEGPLSAGVEVSESGFCIVDYSNDMDSAASWTVNATADTDHTFGWDYSTVGIPPSPNGDGTTTGLQMKANISSGAASYLVATPNSVSMTGKYQVRFDFWINANGPFPAGGGGSTEFIGGGVGYDGTTAGYNGAMLMITGEGGSSYDWRLYKDTGLQYTASGQYHIASNNNWDAVLSDKFPAQEAPEWQQLAYPANTSGLPSQSGSINTGCGGFAWHTMEITVDSDAGLANFAVDGLSIGTLVCDGSVGASCATSGPLSVAYSDIYASVSDNAAMSFGVIDNYMILLQQEEPVTQGDWDGDGNIDIDDYAKFADCLAGPGATPDPSIADCSATCLATFDFDADGDVDLKDFSEFVKVFN